MPSATSWSDVGSSAVAVAALAVASSQAALAHRQTRRAEVTLTRELLTTWNQVSDSWRVCMAVEGLGDDFYARR
jgi:hypothetical protein